MVRRERNWHPNGYFHIVVRGNNRQNIFRDAKDMYEYFRVLQAVHDRFSFELLAYCVMTNHVHLLMRSPLAPLGDVMMMLNKRYSDYYRKRHHFVGQIYQNRYYSKEVEGKGSLLFTSAYIHRNPIDTKKPMVAAMEDYPYSSYQYYATDQPSPYLFMNLTLLPSLLPPELEKTRQAYAEWCKTVEFDK